MDTADTAQAQVPPPRPVTETDIDVHVIQKHPLNPGKERERGVHFMLREKEGLGGVRVRVRVGVLDVNVVEQGILTLCISFHALQNEPQHQIQQGEGGAPPRGDWGGGGE